MTTNRVCVPGSNIERWPESNYGFEARWLRLLLLRELAAVIVM